MIIQVDGALDGPDCTALAGLYDRHARASSAQDYTGHPLLFWRHLRGIAEARALLAPLVARCRELVAGASSQPLYAETVALAMVGPGGRLPRHADNSRQEPDGSWMPNHTPQRDVSAIYYLNGDFEGGELLFPQWGILIKPRRGLLVGFPSDSRHVHEVLPVRHGHRYTVPIWFSHQASVALEDLCTDGAADPAPPAQRAHLRTI